MPTASARPDHLRQYAADTAATTTRSTAAVDEVARALGRHLAGGGEPGTVLSAVTAARAAVQGAATLGAAARQIAAAFEAADRGPAPNDLAAAHPPVTATDVSLARAVRSVAAGIADEELLAPARFAAGAAWAEKLVTLPFAEQLARLASLERTDDHGPEFAAGALRALGPAGLCDLVAAVRTEYEALAVELGPADDALRDLAALFEEATRTLIPATTPAELEAALRADAGRFAGSTSTFQLDLVRALGRTPLGQDTLRHLIIDPLDLPAQVVAAVVDELTTAPASDDDGRITGHQPLLDRRMGWRYRVIDRDLPALHQLARSPLAAWRWERAGGPERSRIAAHLGRGGWDWSNALAGVVRGALAESVRQGWAGAFEVPLLGAEADPHALSSLVDLPAIIRAAGQARPTPALSRALADVLATHPEAFRELAGRAAYRSTPSATLTDYFTVLAADRRALAAATDTALGAFGREAARVLGRTPPGTVDETELLGGLADSHGVTIALEQGAFAAGQHHDAAAAFALTVVGMAGTKGSKSIGRAGPVGRAIGWVGDKSIRKLEGAAAERWVDTNDGRSRGVASATARSEPYLLAYAMARNPRWGALVVDPDGLRGLDVVGSTADRRAFRAWLERQPPVVASPIASLMAPAA